MTNAKGGASANAGGVFGEGEKVLQAVVLADSFNERFMPITLDHPRCLLPLVNVPIIEYTFEFLAVSRVQEVILFCRAHADQIKQYLRYAPRPARVLTAQQVALVQANVDDAHPDRGEQRVHVRGRRAARH